MKGGISLQICDRRVRARDAAPGGRLLSQAWQERILSEDAIDMSPVLLADELVACLPNPNGRGPLATLIVPSSWCYVHPVSVPQRRPSHASLVFAFEAFAPADAEGLVCEFLPGPGGSYLGVGVEAAALAELLAQLRTHGIDVERITLDVFHACADSGEAVECQWWDDGHFARVSLGDGQLRLRVFRYTSSPLADTPCTALTDAIGSSGSLPACIDGVGDALVIGQTLLARSARMEAPAVPATLASEGETPSVRVPESPSPEKTRGLAALQKSLLSFNLARDALAPPGGSTHQRAALARLAMSVSVAAVILFVGCMIFRSNLGSTLETVRMSEEQLFRETLPGQAIPRGVALRLASERRRLEGLTLATPDAVARTDALRVLHSVVSAIPTDLLVDIEEMRIDGTQVTLRGRTRDHPHAERLTRALDDLQRLECPAPRTDRHRDGGVQFYAHARIEPAVKPARMERRP